MSARGPDRSRPTLGKELGGRVPAGLSELGPAERQHLAEAIREARRRQSEELARAGERALSHIPRVLRGPIRKIVR